MKHADQPAAKVAPGSSPVGNCRAWKAWCPGVRRRCGQRRRGRRSCGSCRCRVPFQLRSWCFPFNRFAVRARLPCDCRDASGALKMYRMFHRRPKMYGNLPRCRRRYTLIRSPSESGCRPLRHTSMTRRRIRRALSPITAHKKTRGRRTGSPRLHAICGRKTRNDRRRQLPRQKRAAPPAAGYGRCRRQAADARICRKNAWRRRRDRDAARHWRRPQA